MKCLAKEWKNRLWVINYSSRIFLMGLAGVLYFSPACQANKNSCVRQFSALSAEWLEQQAHNQVAFVV